MMTAEVQPAHAVASTGNNDVLLSGAPKRRESRRCTKGFADLCVLVA